MFLRRGMHCASLLKPRSLGGVRWKDLEHKASGYTTQKKYVAFSISTQTRLD